MLGDKILELRKKQGLSQEQLGEQVNVTRQTISNWELNETAPNPEQLKLLSKALNVSIDELLDNERKEVLMNKVSNTERLAGIIIKLLKVFGVIFIIYIIFIVIAMIGLGIYSFKTNGKVDENNVSSSETMICTLNKGKYQIEFGTDDSFNCNNCSNQMKKELKEIIDFNNLNDSVNNVKEYFTNNNGSCD